MHKIKAQIIQWYNSHAQNRNCHQRDGQKKNYSVHAQYYCVIHEYNYSFGYALRLYEVFFSLKPAKTQITVVGVKEIEGKTISTMK